MIVAYTWQNKIVFMSDSRASSRDSDEKMLDYNDEHFKFIPVQNELVIAHAGLRKVYLGENKYFDLNEVTKYFLEKNQKVLSLATGKQLLEGLVEMWNSTLSEKLGRNPFSPQNRFSFLFAKFEKNIFGEIIPQIHSYQSHLQDYSWGGNKAVIGDDGVYPIMMPYYETDTDNWTFEKSLDFYKKGFAEVMEQVETVGGPIDIYVLDPNPNNSYWIQHKPFN